MKFLIIVAFLFFTLFSLVFRTTVLNPFKSIYYFFVDTYHYFRFKQWRNAPCGELVAYVGLFGKGKTLSAVHTCRKLYQRYNNKKVYDSFRKKWVTQYVVILSNVDLVGIPFLPFVNLEQIVLLSQKLNECGSETDSIFYLYVLGDEFSVQLNSRNFKSNINANVLNSILTCRHYHLSIYYTAQRFNHVDALLRQVTQTVISCNKWLRFQRQYVFDGYELENSNNPTTVRPKRRKCFFVTNKDYNSYNTLACVDNLSKDALDGNFYSDLEILQMQGSLPDQEMDPKKRRFKHVV